MIAFVLCALVWVGAGVYLLLHGHPFVGVFALIVASAMEYKKTDEKDEEE